LRLTAGAPVPIPAPAGIQAEPPPEGHWNMNYAALAMHRRRNWLATVCGHSRYLRRGLSCNNGNLFGRYITFGQLEILPQSDELKCFRHDGWDWNRWPGITAPVKPLKLLSEEVRNLDENSGFEEMLLSTEAFAGGINLNHRNGIFGMILHGHPKYEKNFRARKSWFFLDNLIVCLGSGIYSEDTQNPVHTTLFQTPLAENDNGPFSAPDLCGYNFNAARIDSCGTPSTWISDSVGNSYYLPTGEFSITFGEQVSPAQHDGSYTAGRFACAWLDHGIAPEHGDYAYAVLPQCKDETPEFVAAMKGDTPPYVILRRDDNAHIVRYPGDNLTGYVMFRSGSVDVPGPVVAVDTPCLVMAQTIGRTLKLSVGNPDLRLYEGDDKDQYDADGNQVEVSLYSRLWAANSSRPAPLRLRLLRRWELRAGNGCHLVESNDHETILEFICHDGLTFQAELTR
ncbi:MAG: polysaccharide lyase family 8 super-sandwich domain-containing protein, partial [Victivallales bacterium]|nr:polysaccharide lyase family 8 super-sandwich domain-containing protein [Victivallales bacterium]